MNKKHRTSPPNWDNNLKITKCEFWKSGIKLKYNRAEKCGISILASNYYFTRKNYKNKCIKNKYIKYFSTTFFHVIDFITNS